MVFLCFCIQSAQKHDYTFGVCNMLLKMIKICWFSVVFASKVVKNYVKPMVFALVDENVEKTIGVPLFCELRLQKTQ